MTVRNYQELIAWQKAMDLVDAVYEVVGKFPREELYGLTAQLKRAVISVPSNIAEGQGRRTTKDFVHFLYISYGSLREVETQLMIGARQKFMADDRLQPLLDRTAEVGRIINGLIRSLGCSE